MKNDRVWHSSTDSSYLYNDANQKLHTKTYNVFFSPKIQFVVKIYKKKQKQLKENKQTELQEDPVHCKLQ